MARFGMNEHAETNSAVKRERAEIVEAAKHVTAVVGAKDLEAEIETRRRALELSGVARAEILSAVQDEMITKYAPRLGGALGKLAHMLCQRTEALDPETLDSEELDEIQTRLGRQADTVTKAWKQGAEALKAWATTAHPEGSKNLFAKELHVHPKEQLPVAEAFSQYMDQAPEKP